MSFFLRGVVIGFSIAAPVGPIGLLCIHRTLAHGRASGFMSGLGAATADALYGAVAAFGLTIVAQALAAHQFWLRAAGGVFLCGLGVKTFMSRLAEGPTRANGNGLAAAYASTLFLTLTNPATILSFAAVFAGFGLGTGGESPSSAAAMVSGVFLGSALWWLLLSGVVALFRERLGSRLIWVNRASGAILLGFGIAAVWSVK
ncbi:MAG: LysE family transporter [Elusimicrobia bacterium]|nr:LysE family transporter [Elusimicrobiota bacterium]